MTTNAFLAIKISQFYFHPSPLIFGIPPTSLQSYKTLISDLDTSRDNWLIKVRVCRMWEFKNYKRSNEMISLDMILIEEKGTLVYTVIWRNQVNRFHANLREGSLTAIQKIQEDTVNILSNGLQFIKQNIIRSTVNNNTFLTDVVGCICGIGDRESVGSGINVTKITLCGGLWRRILPVPIPPRESGQYIVIVTTTTVKEFRGEITFSTTAASKTYVNLPMANVTSLIQKFATKTIQKQIIESANGRNIPIDEAMFENRMTAQIAEIDNFVNWHYISSNLCNNKIEPTDCVYRYHKCGKKCDFPLRYKIHIKVKVNGGEANLVLFNGVAEKLLDTSAFKLLNRSTHDDKDVPSQIESLCSKDIDQLLKKEIAKSQEHVAEGSHNNDSEEYLDEGKGEMKDINAPNEWKSDGSKTSDFTRIRSGGCTRTHFEEKSLNSKTKKEEKRIHRG
uniref:Uncharacterized protein n=1 Tax=Solanum lycopersicum TaxID=4081 RepID=A0A3Q7IGZ1_SOLLC